MTLLRYEPWGVMDRLHRQIDQLFGDAFPAPSANGESAPTWAPAVDVREEPERFLVYADLPGVDPKDIQVTADDGVLSIRGERRLPKRAEAEGFERLERASGPFLRRFVLPEQVQTEQIKARYTQGVLEVSIPKVAPAEPTRVSVEVH